MNTDKFLPILNVFCAGCFLISSMLNLANTNYGLFALNSFNTILWLWIGWNNSKAWRKEIKDKKEREIQKTIRLQKQKDAEDLFKRQQFDFTGMQGKAKK